MVCTRRWLLNDLVPRLDAGAHASPGVCSSRQPLGPGPSSLSDCLSFFVLLPRDPDAVPSRVVNSQTGCQDWCSGVSESPEFDMGPWALPRPPGSVWADLLLGPRRSPYSTPPCPLAARSGNMVGGWALWPPRAAPWVAVGAHGASAARVSGSRGTRLLSRRLPPGHSPALLPLSAVRFLRLPDRLFLELFPRNKSFSSFTT